MTSIMVNKKIIKQTLKVICSIAFWLIIWQIASVVINDDLKLFLPSPVAVFKKFGELCTTSFFYSSMLASILRILIGFILGSVVGVIFGVLTSEISLFDVIFSPAFKIIRAVPVVSFIILAYLFIDVDNLPIFIAFLMVVPLVWQTTHDSLKVAVPKLCEMGKVFGLNRLQILLKIKIPAVSNEIISVTVSGLGFAWKSGIAAEVLCNPAVSLGKSISRAKGNISYDEVYAITITIVILSIIVEILFKHLCKLYVSRRKKRYAET